MQNQTKFDFSRMPYNRFSRECLPQCAAFAPKVEPYRFINPYKAYCGGSR